MNVTVLLFARAKELAGSDSVAVSAVTVGELRAALAAAVPPLAALLPRCVIAVNHDFADDAHAITSADEIAVIPPVSGG